MSEGMELQTAVLTPEAVKQQVGLIHKVLSDVMKQDEHYGIIPGCKKPSLYKSGAEKLSLTFRLAPTYTVQHRELRGEHIEYEVKCDITHIESGKFLGSGVGSCSTMESKFRYRWESTGKQVPGSYWKNRDKKLVPEGAMAKKVDGVWVWAKKVENDNPADNYNTVLKMAKKRAHVDAILTVTAASDLFTQDIEDLPDFQNNRPKAEKPKPKPEEKKEETGPPAAAQPDIPEGKGVFSKKKKPPKKTPEEIKEEDRQREEEADKLHFIETVYNKLVPKYKDAEKKGAPSLKEMAKEIDKKAKSVDDMKLGMIELLVDSMKIELQKLEEEGDNGIFE